VRSKLAEREEELAALRPQLTQETQQLVAALDEAKASAEHLEGRQRSLQRKAAMYEQQVSHLARTAVPCRYENNGELDVSGALCVRACRCRLCPACVVRAVSIPVCV
jgi:hypothetical protein